MNTVKMIREKCIEISGKIAEIKGHKTKMEAFTQTVRKFSTDSLLPAPIEHYRLIYNDLVCQLNELKN